MKKYTFFILIFCLAVTLLSIAYATDKNPLKQSAIIKTSIDDEMVKGEVRDFCILKDGSMIVVGTTTNDQYKLSYLDKRTQGDLESTSLIFKYNKEGKLVKFITFGGEKEDTFNSVVATSDGGFVVTGYTAGFTNGDYEKYDVNGSDKKNRFAVIVKFDKDCNDLWMKEFTYKKVSCITSINEGVNGELYGDCYALRGPNDTMFYSFKLDKKGKSLLEDDLTEIPEYAYRIMDNGEKYMWGYKDAPSKKHVAFLSKTDKDGNLVYTKHFEGSGHTLFDELIFTTDGNMILFGSYEDCVSGKDFEKLNMNLKDRTSANGLMIILCDKNGEFKKGVNMPSPNTNDHLLIRMPTVLNNGDILFEYRSASSDYIYNHINNKKIKIENRNDSIFLYRIDKNINFKTLYELKSDNLAYARSMKVLDDGSFSIISMSNYESFKFKEFNFVDKYEFDKAIGENEGHVKSSYTEQTWNVFSTALNKAISINSNTKVSQSETNSALAQLKSSVAALEKKTNVEPLATNTPTPTNTPIPTTTNTTMSTNKAEVTLEASETPENTIKPTSTEVKNDDIKERDKHVNNNFKYFIVIGISIVSVATIGAFLLYKKKRMI